LVPTARFGLTPQTTVTQSLRAGTDLVILSGDLLLGGPPCGIILGRRNLVQRIATHPLATVTTPGKLTVSALTATLRLYLDASRAEREIPVLSLLTTPLENLRNRAERLAPQLQATPAVTLAQPVEEAAFLTDSRCPRDALSTWAIRLIPAVGELTAFAARLRNEAGILVRVRAQDLLIDLRTVFPRQDTHLVAAFEAIGKSLAT
jgi:L-seryl-tRNA(Ser) seleniumtransferase